jgi:hypothetical protein
LKAHCFEPGSPIRYDEYVLKVVTNKAMNSSAIAALSSFFEISLVVFLISPESIAVV